MNRTRCFCCLSLLLITATSESCSGKGNVPPAVKQTAAPPTAPARSVSDPTLDEATSEIVQAIRDEDIPTFLARFSAEKPWTMLSTHAVVPADLRMSRSDLARELEAKGQIHAFLFGPRPWALRAFTVSPYEKAWEPLSAFQFGPPGVRRGDVAIAWRQEDKRWVVDAIAWPIQ